MTFRTAMFALMMLALPWPVQAQETPSSAQSEYTHSRLVSEYEAIVPGKPETLNVAVVLDPTPGWHTYWENPGDAGLPVTLTWILPEGFAAGGIDWPAPEPILEGPLLTYSYKSSLFLPVAITPPANLEKGHTYPIKVKAEWLICKDICVPDTTELQINMTVADGEATRSGHAGLFEAHRKTNPVMLDMPGSFSSNDKNITLTLPLSALNKSDISTARFFIREQNMIHYAADQVLSLDQTSLHLTLERADDPPGDSISGILTLTGKDGSTSHYNVSFASGGVASMDSTNGLWFPVVLLFAVLGGLILNLMPCVLPVLSLKALAIAKKGGGKHEHVVQQGVAYTVGIMLSFAVIAGTLLILRGAGEAIGWGYQMQSPGFVGFLIYLLFLVGLSLSGLFHLPVVLGNVGAGIANESSARGSFFTGILATAVATPCTAPFMASAVGAALTMPAWQALLVFEALGFGLALPFLLISLFPRLRAFLPNPGAWMDTFKQLIAFPMYASVIWLLWVLTLQTGAGGMVVALGAMLLILIVLWMKSLFKDNSHAYHVTALAMFAAILLGSLPMLNSMEGGSVAMPSEHSQHDVETVPYSKEKLAELRKEGKPVLIDATAAWCITCQVNARVAIHTDRTMKELKERGVVFMIADWTRRNAEITEFLSSFGYKGVPLCVFYPGKNGKPVVLPQLLTEDIVINAIKGEE